jgi:hypothetical protein
VDNLAARTVQFDVQLSTFTRTANGYVLCALLDEDRVDTVWLVPAAELQAVARNAGNKLTIVASAKPSSKDRYTPFRHEHIRMAAQRLASRFDGAGAPVDGKI